MTDQSDYERLSDDIRKDFARRLSHVQSEVGLCRRDVEDMRQACKEDIQGTQDSPGLLVRVALIEHDRERDVALIRWLIGGSLGGLIIAVLTALKALGLM